jgi:hypothetical protein
MFIAVVMSIASLVPVVTAFMTGSIGVDLALVAGSLPVVANRASVFIFRELEDALATTGEMLGVPGADVHHLLDLGHQRVRLMTKCLHVTPEIFGRVTEETDLGELVVALVVSARLVRVGKVEVRFGFLVNSDEFVQGELLLGDAIIAGGGLGRLGDHLEVVRVDES